MIPFTNAFQSFISIFSLLPLPFRAFITTFTIVMLALAILRILTTRT